MTREELASKAHGLFLAGYDTMAIAAELRLSSEAKASTAVWCGRCWAKGLPADYAGEKGAVLRVAPVQQQKSA